jgi:hypothetical protein|tara:strand:- start:574 stop:813 length:240 start_codon:yes stop_codon:yes gene_type:complete
MNNLVLKSVGFAVFLNLVLPFFLRPFATDEEKMPPNGAGSLDYKGQFMHMMVHHNQVPLMSSFIVGLIVGLSVFFSQKI